MTDEAQDQERQTRLVPVELPGAGQTYLDQSMIPRVQRFIERAAEEGVQLHFNSAYRTPQHQAGLRNDPNAITPATNSLHSAGFAVDVNFSTLPPEHRLEHDPKHGLESTFQSPAPQVEFWPFPLGGAGRSSKKGTEATS